MTYLADTAIELNEIDTFVIIEVTTDAGVYIMRYSQRDAIVNNCQYDFPSMNPSLGSTAMPYYDGVYEGRLLKIGTITRALPNASVNETEFVRGSRVKITLSDNEGTIANYASQVHDAYHYGIVGSRVRVFCKPHGSDVYTAFVGTVTGYGSDEGVFTIDATDLFSDSFTKLVNVKYVSQTNWPYIDEDDIGRMFPIIYGQMKHKKGAIKLFCLNPNDPDPSWKNHIWAVAGHKLLTGAGTYPSDSGCPQIFWEDRETGEFISYTPSLSTYTVRYDSALDVTYLYFNDNTGGDGHMFTNGTNSWYLGDIPTGLPGGVQYAEGIYANVNGKPQSDLAITPLMENPADILADFIFKHTEYQNWLAPASKLIWFYNAWSAGMPGSSTWVKDKMDLFIARGAGWIDEARDPLDVIRSMCHDFCIRLYLYEALCDPVALDRYVSLAMDIPGLTYSALGTAEGMADFIVTDVSDILDGSLTVDYETSKVVNRLVTRFEPDFPGHTDNDFLSRIVVEDTTSQQRNRRVFEEEMDLEWVRNTNTATIVSGLTIWRHAYPLARISFDTAMQTSPYNPTDLGILICHPMFPDWRLIMIEEWELNPDTLRMGMNCLDVTTLYGLCYILVDDLDGSGTRYPDSYNLGTDTQKAVCGFLCDDEIGSATYGTFPTDGSPGRRLCAGA